MLPSLRPFVRTRPRIRKSFISDSEVLRDYARTRWARSLNVTDFDLTGELAELRSEEGYDVASTLIARLEREELALLVLSCLRLN